MRATGAITIITLAMAYEVVNAISVFGSSFFPTTPAEAQCDGLAMIVIAIGLHCYFSRRNP